MLWNKMGGDIALATEHVTNAVSASISVCSSDCGFFYCPRMLLHIRLPKENCNILDTAVMKADVVATQCHWV